MGVTGGVFHGIGYSINEDLHAKYLDTTEYQNKEGAKAAYDGARNEEVRPIEAAAYVFYGLGGVAVVAGIVTLAVRKPGGATGKDSGVTVSPMLMPGRGPGAMMTLEF